MNLLVNVSIALGQKGIIRFKLFCLTIISQY